MSSAWEPNRHAVHRLIQIVDVLAIAFNRFRQRSFQLPVYQPSVPFDTAGWQSGVARILSEFSEVRGALFAGTVAPAREAERLGYEAIARFAADGARDDTTVGAVARAAEWIGAVGTPWVVGTPRPWDYGQYRVESYDATKQREDRFEQEFQILQQYPQVRDALIFALARIGQAIPAGVYERHSLAHAPEWDAEKAPLDQPALLDLARETRSPPQVAKTVGGGGEQVNRGLVEQPIQSAASVGTKGMTPLSNGRILEDSRVFSPSDSRLVQMRAGAESAEELLRIGREVWQHLATTRTVHQDEHHKGELNVRAANAARNAVPRVPLGDPAFPEWERRVKAAARACGLAIRHQGEPARLDQLLEALGDLENAFAALPPLPSNEVREIMALLQPATVNPNGENRHPDASRAPLEPRATAQSEARPGGLVVTDVPNSTEPNSPEDGGDVPLSPGTVVSAQAMLAHLNTLASSNTTVRGFLAEAAARHTDTTATPTKPNDAAPPPPVHEPDGPFGIGGFRFAGVEVQFNRATLRYRLVLALWSAATNAPTGPRSVEDVLVAVYGEEHDKDDAAFRQLCSDARAAFQRAGCLLDIRSAQGMVQLVRV